MVDSLRKTAALVRETRALCDRFEANARAEGREYSPELRKLRQSLDEAPGDLAKIAAEKVWLDNLGRGAK